MLFVLLMNCSSSAIGSFVSWFLCLFDTNLHNCAFMGHCLTVHHQVLQPHLVYPSPRISHSSKE